MTAGCSVETSEATLVAGGAYTTLQLKCELPESAANVYVLTGTEDTPMSFPAAYQVPAPFGSDTGAPNPAFLAFDAGVAPFGDVEPVIGDSREDSGYVAGQADLVVALGSSLSVHPASAIPRLATRRGVPYVIINRGPTEHDGDADVTLRLDGDVEALFPPPVLRKSY